MHSALKKRKKEHKNSEIGKNLLELRNEFSKTRESIYKNQLHFYLCTTTKWKIKFKQTFYNLHLLSYQKIQNTWE